MEQESRSRPNTFCTWAIRREPRDSGGSGRYPERSAREIVEAFRARFAKGCDAGVWKRLSNAVLEPANPFDVKARRQIRQEALILGTLVFTALGVGRLLQSHCDYEVKSHGEIQESLLDRILRRGEDAGLLMSAVALVLVEAGYVAWLERLPAFPSAAHPAGFIDLPPWYEHPRVEVTLLLTILGGMIASGAGGVFSTSCASVRTLRSAPAHDADCPETA